MHARLRQSRGGGRRHPRGRFGGPDPAACRRRSAERPRLAARFRAAFAVSGRKARRRCCSTPRRRATKAAGNDGTQSHQPTAATTQGRSDLNHLTKVRVTCSVFLATPPRVVVFASSTDHRRSVASRPARNGLHGSFNLSRAGIEGGWATLIASRRQCRDLMKKHFSPTKRQEEHEKPVSSILLATTA
jgi:hypothetical protein